MKQRFYSFPVAILLVFSLLLWANVSSAQESAQQVDQGSSPAGQVRRPGFVGVLGGILLTPFVFVHKLAACVNTQIVAGAAYIATFEVEGNYEGGTNGREIGEVARRSCTGGWWVRPSDVARDYFE